MNPIVMTALLVVANVLGASMALPQAVRLARTRNVDGVSAVWAGVSLVMNLWWLLYGLANEIWALVPVSAVSSVLYATIIVTLLVTSGRSCLPGLALGALGLGMLPLPVLLGAGWTVVGVVIGLGYGMQLSPAVVAACRSRRLDGIAPATWLLAWVEAAIWLVYGAVVVDSALLVGGGSGVAMSSVILGRLAVTGHRPFRALRPAWGVA